MATVTDPIGNTDKAITQYEFFKSILSFYAGDAADDEYIVLNGANMMYSGAPLDEIFLTNFNSSDISLSADKCLVNGNIARQKYWDSLKNTYYVPLAGTVMDLTTVYPWSGSSLGAGQIMTGNNTYTPFDTMSCFHNWLTDKVILKLDTSDDGGISDSEVSVKANFLGIHTATTTSSTRLWFGTTTNYSNGNYIGVSSQHLYVNKTTNYPQRLIYNFSSSTYSLNDGLLTVNVYTGDTETLAKTTSFTAGYSTDSVISGSTLLGNSTPTNFPTKIEITLPVKRNITWIIIDLSNLIGATVSGIELDESFLDLSYDAPYLSGFTHMVAGWREDSTYDVAVVENQAYIDVQYEVWNEEDNDNLRAFINIKSLKNNVTGRKPALQLGRGMWLCTTSYNLNSPPVATGDYTSTWAGLIGDIAPSDRDTIFFSKYGLKFFHNLTVMNKLSYPVEVNSEYISGGATVSHGLAGDVTVIIYNERAPLSVRMYLDRMGSSRIDVTCSSSEYYHEVTFNMYEEFGNRGGQSFIIELR